MKIWQRFQTLSRAAQIASVVFFLHLATVTGLGIHHWIHSKKAIKTKIAVRTFQKSAPLSLRSLETNLKERQAQKTQAAQQAVAPPKQVTSKKAASKVLAVKKEIKALSSSDEKLFQEIAENLKILNEETNIPSRPTLSVPLLAPPSIQLEENELPDPSYGDILIAFLQSALDLPEYGAVQVQLEIDAGGRLKSVKVLEAQSQKNEEFLKDRLPELVFPRSDDLGRGSSSFTITFKNSD